MKKSSKRRTFTNKGSYRCNAKGPSRGDAKHSHERELLQANHMLQRDEVLAVLEHFIRENDVLVKADPKFTEFLLKLQ